jgi:hypothetical protein
VGLAAGAHCGGGLFLEGWSVAPAFRAYHEERCAEVAVLGFREKPTRYLFVESHSGHKGRGDYGKPGSVLMQVQRSLRKAQGRLFSRAKSALLQDDNENQVVRLRGFPASDRVGLGCRDPSGAQRTRSFRMTERLGLNGRAASKNDNESAAARYTWAAGQPGAAVPT